MNFNTYLRITSYATIAAVADMSTAYKLSAPVEVTKPDYDGRKLEIWAEAKDTSKLQATVREILQMWNALRPSIAEHNPAEAKKFGELIAQVEGAKTPSDYARLAKPVLDEVDNLEKFLKSGRRSGLRWCGGRRAANC